MNFYQRTLLRFSYDMNKKKKGIKMERKNVITMGGNPLTLQGPDLKVGDKAPEFNLLDNSLAPVRLSDSSGKPRLLSIVPSLDTGVCSLQTQKFNNKLAELADKAELYTISADLPFAQSRFNQEHEINKIKALSDHRDVSFASNYGLLIKELRLLARAVVIIDKDDNISYMQVVPEVTDEPDYDKALEALNKVIG